MDFLAVKNFSRFQHYRDRNPPWIKLYGDVLVDAAFLQMPEAAQAQLMKLWVLASQFGHPLPNNPKLLAGKIGTTGKFHLASMVAAGFLIPCRDVASAAIAESQQNDIPSVRGRIERSELEDDAVAEKLAEHGVDEPSLTALYVTIWSNKAVTEKWGEQPHPYTQGASVELAEQLRKRGMAWQTVRDSIYRQCAESRQPRPPRAPNYFRRGIEDDWEQELARRAVARTPDISPASVAAKPASSQGRGAMMLADIRALVVETRLPGQAVNRFIPKAKVAALGADVLKAYEAVGGAERVLNCPGEQMGFLVRDFTNALEAARVSA